MSVILCKLHIVTYIQFVLYLIIERWSYNAWKILGTAENIYNETR